MSDLHELLTKDYYEENTLVCIPLFIYPHLHFQAETIEIIEGVNLRAIALDEMNETKKAFQHHDLRNKIPLTHFICIDRPDYLSAVKKRIIKSGSDLPEFIHIEQYSIVKQTLLSIFLVAPIGFQVDAGGSIKLKSADGERTYQGNGWSKGWLYEVLDQNQQAIVSCGLREEALNINQVREIAHLLDPYFRAGVWWQDRMAASLAHLLDAICCNSTTLTFLSLTSAIEALVNSSKNEITHQIGERVAILCGKTKEGRLDIYHNVKKLYNTRSTLVHGQAHKMKGLVTMNSLLVSPKLSVVPIDDLRDLFRITILTIRESLRNEDLINIYESSRDEAKVNKKLTEFFISRLL